MSWNTDISYARKVGKKCKVAAGTNIYMIYNLYSLGLSLSTLWRHLHCIDIRWTFIVNSIKSLLYLACFSPFYSSCTPSIFICNIVLSVKIMTFKKQ